MEILGHANAKHDERVISAAVFIIRQVDNFGKVKYRKAFDLFTHSMDPDAFEIGWNLVADAAEMFKAQQTAVA
jgi:hypothetical protein